MDEISILNQNGVDLLIKDTTARSQISNLSNKIGTLESVSAHTGSENFPFSTAISFSSGVSIDNYSEIVRYGRMAHAKLRIKVSSNIASWTTLFTLLDKVKPSIVQYGLILENGAQVQAYADGRVQCNASLSAGTYTFLIDYITD